MVRSNFVTKSCKAETVKKKKKSHVSALIVFYDVELIFIPLNSKVQCHLGKRIKEVFIFGLGHMTKMAAMLIHGERLKRYSSPKPLCSLL